MARREVRCVKLDGKGEVVAVGNTEEWGIYYRDDVIQDIATDKNSYYVDFDGEEVDVEIYDREFLRTEPDNPDSHNLDELPICE